MSDLQTPAAKEEGVASRFLHLFFASREADSNNTPKGIPNLEVTLEGGGKTYKLRTGSGGELPIAKFNGQKINCKVRVTLPNGNEEDLGEIVLDREDNAHTYISPYTVKKAVLERHTGTPPKKADKPVSTNKPNAKLTVEDIKNAKRIGETSETRSENGNPVTLITVDGECCDKANTKNLKLMDNVIYRDIILDAADRGKIIPQAIAALIFVEAASERLTVEVTMPPKQMTDEEAQAIKVAEAKDAAAAKKEQDDIAASKLDTSAKGKQETKRLEKLAKNNARAREKIRNEEAAKRIKRAAPVIRKEPFKIWNPYSINDPKKSPETATGLTQFLGSTWIGEAKRDTFLRKAALGKDKGYVKKVKKPDTTKQGNLMPFTKEELDFNAKAKAFNAQEKNKAKHIKLKQQKRETITVPGKEVYEVVNEPALLDMRFDPLISINAAVDYAVFNLNQLIQSYSAIASQSDGNKAKLMYLAHHLGLGDCRKFIEGTIKDDVWVKNEDGTPKLNKKGKPILIVGAETLLTTQVGGKLAQELYKDDESWIFAHRRWLMKKLDNEVDILNFACNPSKVAKADLMFTIIQSIGGKHPEGFSI